MVPRPLTYARPVSTPASWDALAARYDEADDHGLGDPAVRAAWRELLTGLLPPAPARVADLGCGTGTLTLLLAEAGHRVDGVDFSRAMVRRARAKLAGRTGVTVERGDAADPPLVPSYDVVLCRHVLWALPDPAAALRRWVGLLAPTGRLVLVEGDWHTGAGLRASETVALVERAGCTAELHPLSERVELWGGPVPDERYAVVGRPAQLPKSR